MPEGLAFSGDFLLKPLMQSIRNGVVMRFITPIGAFFYALRGLLFSITALVIVCGGPVAGQPVLNFSLSDYNGYEISCHGSSDGTIDLTISGGTAPFDILWSTGDTTEDLSGQPAGIYDVQVIDANSDTADSQVQLNEPDSLALTVDSLHHANCFGSGDGAIYIDATGGVIPYTYLWSEGSATGDLVNVLAGVYTLTITDTNNCTQVLTDSIQQPDSLALVFTAIDEKCDQSDGSVSGQVSGGVLPYSYLWSDSSTDSVVTALAAGTYTLTVTDGNGCTRVRQQVVANIPGPAVGVISKTDVNCAGGSDGSIDVTVSNGTMPFSFQWSSGATMEDIAGLTAGPYTITVTDFYACTATTGEFVDEPDSIQTMLSVTHANGSMHDGSMEASVSGGTTPYSYLWSTGDTTAVIDSLPAGSYTVTITDGHSCVDTKSGTVNAIAACDVVVDSTVNASCYGSADGAIYITVTGAAGPVTFLWSDASTVEDISGLAAGTYTVTITDTIGCMASTQSNVQQPDSLSLSVSIMVETCGASNGELTATAGGGTPGYTFAWSTGATTQTVAGLAAGNYTVTATDNQGCTKASSVALSNIASPVIALDSINHVRCFGESNGDIFISVSGGSPPFTYLWSNTSASQDLLSVTAGTYTVTVTDTNGCVDSLPAVVSQPVVLTLSTSANNETCGDGNGDITASPAGGTTPYGYLWSDAQTTQTATALAAGTFTVTVTDANGCTATKSHVIINNPGPVLALDSVNDVLCTGESNGAVFISVAGGTVPLTYLWSDASTTQDLVGVASGVYSITVTDMNGCTDTLSAYVDEPTPLGALFTSMSSTCGNANGSATANPTGGVTPYMFAWSDSQTNQTATNLTAGNYTVTVTDANGCTVSVSGVVADSPGPTITVDTVVNVSCFGLSDGAIQLSLTGGAMNFGYLWSNAATTQDLTNVVSGTYSVTVTDANGCTATVSRTIAQPTQLNANTSTVNATCGNANGSASVNGSGGNGPYTYLWSGGQTTTGISGLVSGVYTVTVTDDNACSVVGFANVNNTNGPAIIVDSVVDVRCFGQNNGAAYISVSGGTSPYTYLWSNNATAQDLSFVSNGTYTVTVTDANTCTANQTVVVAQPPNIIAVASNTKSTCGFSNGTATVTVSGGVTPYGFLWSTGATTQSITGLPAATYTVTITDDNGCIKTRITVLTNQPDPVITFDSASHVSCFGLADGAVYISKSGGAPPVTYQWSNASSQQDLTNVAAGTYTVTVTDQNGCTDSYSHAVTQPPVLAVSVNTTPATCGNPDGTASASPSGGSMPYSYLWSSGQTTLGIANVSSGTYTVTVTDDNLCSASASGAVTDIPGPSALVDSITHVTCNGLSNGAVFVTPSSGAPPYTYLWTGSVTTQDLTVVPSGTYTLTVTDNNGCTFSLNATVNEPPVLTAGITPTSSTCGFSNGSAIATVGGGTTPYTYAWSGGQTTQSVSGLSAAMYTVTVTDKNGCTASASGTVSNISGPSLSLDSVVHVLCHGDNTGAAYVSRTGGQAPFSYLWSNSASSQDLINVVAGTYTLVVTDDNTCADTLTVNITQPPLLDDSVSTNSTVCGGSSGSAQVYPFGGTMPYTYLWSTSATTQFIVGLTAGAYTVTVTDANGCTSTSVAGVGNIGGATITLDSIVLVSCNGLSNGAIYVTVSGGTMPYTYQWNPGPTTEDNVNIPAGSYTLIVEDGSGCFSSQSFTVNQPDTISISVQTINSLCGGPNGAATANVSGGTMPYSYLWSTAATTQSISGLVPGSYTVTITDVNSCTKAVNASVGNTPGPSIGLDSIVQVKCNGDVTGAIYISVSGTAPPFSYTWSNGAGSQDNIGIAAGTYTVTVTDDNNCTKTASYTVSQPSPLTNLISTTNSTCGAANGTATSLAGGGVSPYSYQWSAGGQTTATITNLVPGAYTATVTDVNGCTVVASGTVVSTGSPVVTFDSVLHVSCNGAGDGAIYVSVTGGQGPYSYNWTPGGLTTQDITFLTPNCYHLIVIDANNCITQVDTCVVQPAVLNDSIQKANETCDLVNGSITVFPYGGTSPYSFLWNTGATTQSLAGLSAGTYTVTITDDNSCTRNETINVLDLSGPVIMEDTVIHVRCFGESNGAIQVSLSGGSAPFTYQWSPGGQTTQDISGLVSGPYILTVTDDNNCTDAQSFVVNQPTALEDSLQVTDAVCGNASGSATVYAYGGTGPYSYIWSSGSNADTIQNKPQGSYVVTITDNNGCTVVDTAAIGNIGGPTVVLDSILPVSCFGGNDGGIYITVVSGSALVYSWSNGFGGQDNLGLQAGTYTVTVTDTNNCVSTQQYVIPGQPAITDSMAVMDATCGQNNGSITVFAGGGAGGFSYVWSNAATTQGISGLVPGVYTVTITDVSGCTHVALDSVLAAPLPAASIGALSPVSCHNGTDGSITVNAGNGLPPYSFLWSNGATTASIGGLAAGPYTVTVTDDNGCTAQTDTSLMQPDSIGVGFSVTNALCNDSNGCATANPFGGTTPYTYAWSTGETTQTICGLPAGSYTVTVTDDLNCTRTDAVNISNVGGASIAVDSVTNVSCHGDSSGAVFISITGGAAPFQYLWSEGSTTQDLMQVPAGWYTLTLTDSAGCSVVVSQQVFQPDPVQFNGATTQAGCNTANGSAAVNPSGGTPGFTFLWSNNATTQGISAIPAGAYTVTVTDTNQCAADTVITITNPNPPVIANASVTHVLCNGAGTGYVDITVSGGTPPYSYVWSNSTVNEDLINSPAGTYTVTVTDDANCTVSGTYTINQPPPIDIQFNVTDAACGDSTGQVIASVSGGIGPYSLMWSTGSTSDTIQNLLAGSYTLTVTDSNMCVVSKVANVSNLMAPVILVSDSSGPSCFGFNDGFIVVSVTGGAMPYNYVWTNTTLSGDSIYNLEGDTTYTLTITDANNCKSILGVYLDEPDSIRIPGIVPLLNDTFHVTCFGGTDGSIDITPSGGIPPYSFSWSNFSQDEDQFNLPADTFAVTVTDSTGCQNSNSFILLQPPPVIADGGASFSLCGLDFDTLRAVEPSYGTGQWVLKSGTGVIQDPDSAMTPIGGLGLGNNVFQWIVSDGVSQCNDTAEVIVSVNSDIIAIAGADRNVCADSITLTATPPQFGYGYWTVVSGSGSISDTSKAKTAVYGLTPGVNSFRWTVVNGLCTDDEDVMVTRLGAFECLDDIDVPTGFTPNGDGKNDVFLILGLEDYPDNTLLIYNRWGNKVFEQSPYLNEWKGTNNAGKLLPEGTYFVILKVQGVEEAFTGYIDLRR